MYLYLYNNIHIYIKKRKEKRSEHRVSKHNNENNLDHESQLLDKAGRTVAGRKKQKNKNNRKKKQQKTSLTAQLCMAS